MKTPLSTAAISAIIGLIYDCALDPQRWPETLTQIHQAMDFAVASLSLLDLGSGAVPLMVSVGLEPKWLEAQRLYGAETIEMWGGLEKILAFPADEPLLLSDVADRSQFETNRFFLEWAIPQGIYDVMTMPLTRDRRMIGSLGFGRHKSKGEIGDLEVETARLLLPHLQRAVAISRLLDVRSVAASTFESALDTFAVGVVLTDADLGIVHANATARAMLATGEPIRSVRGACRCNQPPRHRRSPQQCVRRPSTSSHRTAGLRHPGEGHWCSLYCPRAAPQARRVAARPRPSRSSGDLHRV